MITEQSYIICLFIRRGLPSCILPRFVRHGTEFRVVSLPRNGSKRNSDSLFLFLFHRTESRVVFSSEEGFGTEFREHASICSTERNSELFSHLRKGSERNSESFLFRGTTGIPSEMIICSVYSVFRGIIFLSEIPNPRQEGGGAMIGMFNVREKGGGLTGGGERQGEEMTERSESRRR